MVGCSNPSSIVDKKKKKMKDLGPLTQLELSDGLPVGLIPSISLS